jgi:hypothetical protein
MAFPYNGIDAVAIGTLAGSTNQQSGAIAIGTSAGQTNQGITPIAYSQDGITWYAAPLSATIFTTRGNGVASNPVVGTSIVDSQVVLNNSGYGLSSNLDVIAGGYYNPGYTNFSLDCTYGT